VELVALKAAVEQVRQEHAFSQRRACGLITPAVSTYRYQTSRSDDGLRRKLVELAREKPRFGYRRLHVLLRRSGEAVNHKRVHRVYREAGLSLRRKKRKHCVRVGHAIARVDSSEPGMGAGFRARCGGKRASNPSAQRGGRLYARVFGFGSGHQLRQPESDAGAGGNHR
jgi:HTH-like domain